VDFRAPQPRQSLDDTVLPAVDDGGQDGVLSFLEGVAIAIQPARATYRR
jgi:hypothetical protein